MADEACLKDDDSGEDSSESRVRENRLHGLMRGGSETVIGLVPFTPSAPAYSTNQCHIDKIQKRF